MSITNEKLQIIKDNVSKVYRSGQMDVIKNANSLKGSESNTAMLLDDVSPVTHEMGVKVRKVNLFEGTLNSGIYENENFKISIADSTKYKSMKIYLPVGTYTLASSVSLMLVREVVDGVYGSIAKSGNTYTFSVTVDGDVGFSFRRSDDADWDDSDNVWLNEGSTATAYTPYVPDLTVVKVSRYGKNLFDKDMSFTDENYLPNQNYNSTYFIQLLPNTTYYVKTFNPLKPSYCGYTFINNRPNVVSSTSTAVCVSGNYSTAENDWHIENYMTTDNSGKLYIGNNQSLVNLKKAVQEANIQIELGSTATDYEPYITPTDYTPTEDGTVNGVTSLYPNTTLMTDTDGVIIDCEYIKDIDKAYNKLSAEIALSGGE